MDDKTPGIVETLTANKKMKFGVLFFVLALILGFSAIYMKTETYSEKGYLGSEQTIRIKKPRSNVQGKLYLSYDDSGSDMNQIEVSVLNQNREVIDSSVLRFGDNETLNLSANAEFFRKEEESGGISYSYLIYFSYQPYRVLSIPTLFLTVFGVLLVYKGFDEHMNSLSKGIKSSKSQKKGKDQQEIDFMGVKEKKDEE